MGGGEYYRWAMGKDPRGGGEEGYNSYKYIYR